MNIPSAQIKAEGLCVNLGGTTILQDVSMEVNAGEIIGLIGPNGAGKSTLLRTILGLVPFTSGTVSFGEQSLQDVPLRTRARTIAYAPQGAPIHWPLTVERVVALGRVPHLGPWQEMQASDAACIARVLEETDTHHLRDRIVTSLSGGERANVMLARAMAVEAPFMFADEPVASLDPYHQLSVMETLGRLAKDKNVGVVVVLHDLNLAMRFSDRLCVLDKGRVAAQGTPSDIAESGQLNDIYRVTSIQGMEGGEPYFLPWSRTP
jgi:iron complex transport system ATP-binding protein